MNDAPGTEPRRPRPTRRPRFGVVAIGRNEGERLRRCLESVRRAAPGASSTSIPARPTAPSRSPRELGATVVALDMRRPFTAARARNEGFAPLQAIAPDLAFVQFVDGDCEIVAGWLDRRPSASSTPNRRLAAVCGRRRERYPGAIDLQPAVRPRMGHAGRRGPRLRRRRDDARRGLRQVGGYRDDLIAGEEPELCVRLRAAGWRIWRLDAEMTLHDAAMTRFGQWWQRSCAPATRTPKGVAPARRAARAALGARVAPRLALGHRPAGRCCSLRRRVRRAAGACSAGSSIRCRCCASACATRGGCGIARWRARFPRRSASFPRPWARSSSAHRLLGQRGAPDRIQVTAPTHRAGRLSRQPVSEGRATASSGARSWRSSGRASRSSASRCAAGTASWPIPTTAPSASAPATCCATARSAAARRRAARWLRRGRCASSRALGAAWRDVAPVGPAAVRITSPTSPRPAASCSWLRAPGVDHLHAHFGTNPAEVAMLARELGGPPYSFTVHGPEEFDKPRAHRPRREDPALRPSSSRSARSGAASSIAGSSTTHWPKVHVVHCGLEQAFHPARRAEPPAAPRLVCVGRLCEQKGQLLLLEAAQARRRRRRGRSSWCWPATARCAPRSRR